MDPFSTRNLIATLADLHRPSALILNMFFGNYIGPTGKEEIAFDVTNRVTGMAMFCSPLHEGRPVRERGFKTNVFTPAYVKPWMPFDPTRVLKRRAGEPYMGEESAEEREAALVVQGLEDLYTMLFNRLEKMAGEAMSTGKNIISGDGYATTEVDYGRAAGHTVTLTSTARWGESGVSPVKNVETWVATYIATNGYAPDRIVFDPLAWALFREDPLYEKSINRDYQRQTSGTQGDYLMLGDTVQGQLMGALASGGKTELWVYNQSFKDENGATQKVLPDYSVIMGSSNPALQQTQAFGTILDPELGYSSRLLVDPVTGARMDVAPKSWTTPNPAKRFIMVQSAPLTALTLPNATFAATVR